jgi:hypothetical protein
MEEVKVLHLDLSRQMNAEVELIRGFGPSPWDAQACATAGGCPMWWPVVAAASESRRG